MIHPIPLTIDFIYFHSYTHLYKLLNNNILDFTINLLINVNNNVKHFNFHDALYSLFFLYMAFLIWMIFFLTMFTFQ